MEYLKAFMGANMFTHQVILAYVTSTTGSNFLVTHDVAIRHRQDVSIDTQTPVVQKMVMNSRNLNDSWKLLRYHCKRNQLRWSPFTVNSVKERAVIEI